MALRTVKIDNKHFDISYEIINPSNKKDIIFLHGWGSNKEIMKSFKNNFKDFRHIYIDMPGFGKSSNDYVLTTKDYAKILDKFLEDINVKKEIIVGHSFGGKVATLLNPDLLVLLASAGIIIPKPKSVQIKIKIYKFLKKIGLGSLRDLFVSSDVKGMSENMYETFKKVVDEDFSEEFKNFRNNALIFGGSSDTAVPPYAIKKQSDLLACDFDILNGDHYFFFTGENAEKNRQIIEQKVLECIK
ncbi:2-hydroxy-6-oxohepta-2,4-dienoate hydrolase [Nautilia profundicola AmH]|uniref:2-hydroxy-6-oxohepta-2,4-dienoate hydrolase n=1 Tax=Nautilia profundicola (strain ATCC BAA-1463 / DSM 18972 / AmH) TaxID=598659 RepID=B9L9M4_NAUPA|nr:alpha/beta hydrolase [Nautilia profundicola]ACM93134.1 2-hydroxy-6-oxohepta-2,4-dienoate hydrolase [Nautilia profundicola AmH]